MAVDLKYGKVTTEFGSIGEDEPVIVFRAQDGLLPKLLVYYRLFCWKAKSPYRHLENIDKALAEVERWQEENPSSVKIPD